MPSRSLALASSLLLGGCLCADPAPSDRQPVALTPLARFDLELPPGRSFHAPFGTTERRPFVLVLTDHSSPAEEGSCADWFRLLGDAKSFVLCDETNDLGDGLRAAMKSLKRAAPAHLGRPPIAVVVDRRDATPALDLVSREPAFFAHAAFVGPDLANLSLVWLSNFASKGGLRVLVNTEAEDVRARVVAAARPSGLSVTFVRPGPLARGEVAAFVGNASAPPPLGEPAEGPGEAPAR